MPLATLQTPNDQGPARHVRLDLACDIARLMTIQLSQVGRMRPPATAPWRTGR